MAKIRSTLKIGDQPSERILQEVNSAAKHEPNLEAMPELSKSALKEFAVMAKALKQPRLLKELSCF